ncbi:MAG TPA: tetratricopeptide repeat protein [Saprospiraceae bacterium]|nr:tetratricopeptide repeat protein [Saprospiraceae bacterium]
MHKILLASLLLLLVAKGSAQRNPLSDSLVLQGIHLHDEGKYKEALEKYEQALKVDKKNGYAYYEAGNTYLALKDYKQAIKYADKTIDNNQDALSEAYTLKGNILDMQGKPEKAIEAYREGIRRAPPDPMLHFNLGVTLLQQGKFEEASAEFIGSLKLNGSHASSHYMLGLSYAEQPLKAKTLLPLYHFLLLEPEGQRAEISIKTIQRTMNEGVEKRSEKSFNVNISPAALADEFKTTEMILSLAPLLEQTTRQAIEDSLHTKLPEPTLSQLLLKYNEVFFKSLGETADRPADTFWWDTYADFFIELQQKGHTEAFTNYILLNSADKTAYDWLATNEAKLVAFSDWVEEYDKRK